MIQKIRKTSTGNNSLKKLIVYNKAKDLSVEVLLYLSKRKYPQNKEFLVIQLMRSASSIGANIAEGYGRHYVKSYRHCLSIARGSCFETAYWIEVALKLKWFNNRSLRKFKSKNEELVKILTVMMKKLDQTT